MPLSYANYNCNYTAIATAGTTTVDPGPGSPGVGVGVGNNGVFYGVTFSGIGTGFAVAVYDIIPAQGNNAITTNALMGLQTSTAIGQNMSANGAGPGPRYRGALVVVTSGTAGSLNVYWD